MNKKPTRAERNIAWCEEHLRIPEGKFVGQPLKMADYMKDDFLAIYDNSYGTRRAIISRARKSAKTTECAMILLLHLVGPESKANSQLYSAAMSRDQASVLMNLAAKMVRLSPTISPYVTIRDTKKELFNPELGSLYRALSADASTAAGLSPVLILHDETGQWRGPTSPLYDMLETATAAQEDPLSIVISTQAPNANDLLSILIDDALKGEDPRTVLRFNHAEEGMDPFSIEAIEAANPAFHIFMNKQEVLDMQAQAKRMPSRQAEFENLILNRRVETKSPFMTRPVWQTCNFPVAPKFSGPVYGGLDLSATTDLTAKVYVSAIKDEDGFEKWHVKPSFYLPEEGLIEKSRTDKIPYTQWKTEGYLQTIPGKTIEYEQVAYSIFQDFKEMDIRKIAFDRWNFKHFRPWLLKAGFREEHLEGDNAVFVEFGQGFASMSPSLRTFESLVLNQKLAHGNHPLLAWCVSNAVVTSDPAGNRKLDKMKSNGRIDGIIALAMALSTAETYAVKPKPQPRLIII